MPTKKKKPGAQKRDVDADKVELEALRKQVAEAEEARRQAEAQVKRPFSRLQRQLVRWDGKYFFPGHNIAILAWYPRLCRLWMVVWFGNMHGQSPGTRTSC